VVQSTDEGVHWDYRSLHLKLDLQSVKLACSRFQGHHTADKISDQVDETLAYFGIDDKVTNITTDNAANMTKA